MPRLSVFAGLFGAASLLAFAGFSHASVPPTLGDDEISIVQGDDATFDLFADNGGGADTAPAGSRLTPLYITLPSLSSTDRFQVGNQFAFRFPFVGTALGTVPAGGMTGLVFPDGRLELSSVPDRGALPDGQSAIFSGEYTVGSFTTLSHFSQDDGSVFDVTGSGGTHRRTWDARPVGDFDGDGFDDWGVIIERGSSSTLYVMRGGQNPAFDDTVDFSNLPAGRAIAVASSLWIRFGAIGDINGDGRTDLFVVSPDSGAVQRHIAFGASEAGAIEVLQVSDEDDAYLETTAAGRGDFNDDGIDDAVFSVFRRANNATNQNVVIVFGRTSGFPATLDLTAISSGDGTTIALGAIYINRVQPAWLNDIDGDGINDLLISTHEATVQSDRALVIAAGSDGTIPDEIGFSDLGQTTGYRINVPTGSEAYTARNAGDFNGGGRSDLLILRTRFSASNLEMVFGENLFASNRTVTLDSLPASQSMPISAGGGSWLVQDAWFGVGQLNGDGFTDLVLNANVQMSGISLPAVAVFYGRDLPPPTLAIRDIDGDNGRFFTAPVSGQGSPCGARFAGIAGDLDNNGRDDLFALETDSGDARDRICFNTGPEVFGAAFNDEIASATVEIEVIGRNDPPFAADFGGRAEPRDWIYWNLFNVSSSRRTYDLDAGDAIFVSAIDGNASVVNRWQTTSWGGRYRLSAVGIFEFDPSQIGLHLAPGESRRLEIAYTVTDTGGLSATGTISVDAVNPSESRTIAATDEFVVARDGSINGSLYGDNGHGPDVFDDRGPYTLYRFCQVSTPVGRCFPIGGEQTSLGGATFRVESDGRFTYSPPPSPGDRVEQFTYSFRNSSNIGRSGHVFVAIDGFSDERVSLDVVIDGPEGTELRIDPPFAYCRDNCRYSYFPGTRIEIYHSGDEARDGQQISLPDWGGPCSEATSVVCQFTITEDTVLPVGFTTNRPLPSNVFAAILPAARSMVFGASPVTVFASVANSQQNPLVDCRIEPRAGFPVTLNYQRTDTNNTAYGPINQVFALGPGTTVSFVLGMTATRPFDGRLHYPRIYCANGEVAPSPGVNSIFLSASTTPTPDILSISATPSGDGVIRVQTPGGRRFMSAAAVNIGAGDTAPDGVDGASANEATITVTADTGASVLPLEVTVCETGTDGRCLEPADGEVTSQIGDSAKTFAVFVQASPDAGIAFDPGNSRVYLRFRDSAGVVRSVTSAAVVAPAPANDFSGAEGFWSLATLEENDDGVLTHANAYLLAHGDGRAFLIEGETVRALRWRSAGQGSVEFSDTSGAQLFSGHVVAGQTLRLRAVDGSRIDGVHSGSHRPVAELNAGQYVFQSRDGERRGQLTVLPGGEVRIVAAECAVAAVRDGALMAALVSGCGARGRGELIIFDHVDFDTGAVVRSLAVMTEAGGMAGRIGAVQ